MKPRCQKCGYSKEDAAIHGDHYLCKGTIPKEDEHPLGAIENGRILFERLIDRRFYEEDSSEANLSPRPLNLCEDFINLRQCFEYLVSHVEKFMQPSQCPVCGDYHDDDNPMPRACETGDGE